MNYRLPNILMKDKGYTEDDWEANPSKYVLINTTVFLSLFENSHYASCDVYTNVGK